MSGNLGNTNTSKWTPAQIARMQGLTPDEYNAKMKEENRKKYLAQFAGIDGFGSADTRYMSYPFARSAQENTGDTFRIACLQYIAPTDGGGQFGARVKNKYITQTFADGTSKNLLNTKENRIATDKAKKKAGLDITPYEDMELITTFTDTNTRINNNKIHKYYIELPMPQEVADQNAVTWGDDRMNAIEIAGLSLAQDVMAGGGAEGEGSRVQRSQDAIRAFLEGVSIDGLNSQTTNAIRAAISGAAVGALGSNITASSVIARSTGQILNNNLELLFQGLNLRTFPYSITFSPRSKDESDVVKAIIRSLKMSMAPKAGEFNGSSAQGVFLKSPDVFQLEYLKDGEPHPFLGRMKLTALTGMNVNYTNSGTYTSYEDGTPVNIRMDLTFKEINPIYHEDYGDKESGSGVGY